MSPASSTKANGNIGSLGLKAKSATKEDVTSKKALLDEHVDTGKRKLQTLPVFATQDECEPPAEAKDETAMQCKEEKTDYAPIVMENVMLHGNRRVEKYLTSHISLFFSKRLSLFLSSFRNYLCICRPHPRLALHRVYRAMVLRI
jgi:hypothetical protein